MLTKLTTMFMIAFAAAMAADAPADVPKGATETAPGVYRFVDKDGKAWVYRKTPFGMSKRAEEADAASAARTKSDESSRMTPFGETKSKGRYVDAIERSAATPQTPQRTVVQTKVVEDGDTLHFERPSPFGPYKWSRKKDELTAEETRLWESQRNAAAPAGTNAK